ncbi:MAG: serine protease, partial [Pseudomonadales bacterium]|nr:serine protease [Pseudomonadales bacterium]
MTLRISLAIFALALMGTGIFFTQDDWGQRLSPEVSDQASAPVVLTDDEANNMEVFKNVSPSVVFVTNTALRRNLFSTNATEVRRGSGTGLIWDADGLIVTNFHVIYGAARIIITLQSGNSYNARVVESE